MRAKLESSLLVLGPNGLGLVTAAHTCLLGLVTCGPAMAFASRYSGPRQAAFRASARDYGAQVVANI